MEKIRFAIQVVAFTMALPVYFYLELGHNANQNQEMVKKQTSEKVNYTKNGKDKLSRKISQSDYNINPLTFTISTYAK